MLNNHFLLFACIYFTFLSPLHNNPIRLVQWFMYRGNYAGGALDDARLPEKWDGRTGENIAWKIKIPGLGNSCRWFGATGFL
jgi:hypothetical protein